MMYVIDVGVDQVCMIDVGVFLIRFVWGWHCFGFVETFRDGTSYEVCVFGEKLVVFVGEDGKINAIDAYCCHFGGDFFQGMVKGNNIVCLFYDWRWFGEGCCVGILYAKWVLLWVWMKLWIIMEKNGQLFIWNDFEGKVFILEQDIFEIEGVGIEMYSDWVWNMIVIEGFNCCEIIDNVVDMVYFFYIYYVFFMYFKNIFEGYVVMQYFDLRGRLDVGKGNYFGQDNLFKFEVFYFGFLYMINWLMNDFKGFKVDLVLINCYYFVDVNNFVFQYVVMVKCMLGLDDVMVNMVVQKFFDVFKVGFLQDVEIWKNKTQIENLLLCEEDGPVYQLWCWYQQFYVDVVDVIEDMTARFEFEVDTSHVVEVWEVEVVENLKWRVEEFVAVEAVHQLWVLMRFCVGGF